MADSSYYYNRYREKKREVEKYEKALRELRVIERNLVNEQNNEIDAVNREIMELGADLQQSVQENAVFLHAVSKVYEEIEHGTLGDRHLSGAVSAIQGEIWSVDSKKSQAIADRDYYWRKYQEAKEEERKEFWANLW